MNVRRILCGSFLLAALALPAFSETMQQQSDHGGQAQSPDNDADYDAARVCASAGLGTVARHGGKISADQYHRAVEAHFDYRWPHRVRAGHHSDADSGPRQSSGRNLSTDLGHLERSRSFDLRVDVDVSACTDEEHRVFPDEQITVTPSRAAIVLSGHVSTEDVAKRAGELASAYSPKVVNVLTFGPVGAQEVLLQVKFAEVDRSALTQMGINFISTGAANTNGTVSTGQYGGFGPQTLTPGTSNGTTTTSGESLNNVLNLFVFRPDINFGAVIEALETKNLLQILAEPNLIAVNGKKASFLAGGQFPFPIVQPGNGFTAVTISFKEFGVKLEFTPVITPNGNIHLQVAPEVSTLDFANALTISGFTVPALSTRKAETEFEVQDGQSFVIAGLMDNRVTDIYNKIPGAGRYPDPGQFFPQQEFAEE